MMRHLAFSIIVAFVLLSSGAQAEGTLIHAARRADMVYDDARGVLYITNGIEVLRWEMSTKSFLTPLKIGGQLMGIDISPDHSTIAVADKKYSSGGASNWIHLVDLSTLADTKIRFDTSQETLTSGTFSVAFNKSGKILISSSVAGSGFASLFCYDPATGAKTNLGIVDQDAMLASDARRETIALTGSNNSGGPFGYFRKGKLDMDGQVKEFTYEIGVSPGAKLYAIVAGRDTVIANQSLALTGVVLGDSSGEPTAAVFHPTKKLAYFPWAGTAEVRIYNTTNWNEVGSFDFKTTFDWPADKAYSVGRAKLSADGAFLFVTVPGGVRYVSTGSH